MKKILSGVIAIASTLSLLSAHVLVPTQHGGFDVGPNAHFSTGSNALAANGFLASVSGDQLTDTVFSTTVYWDNSAPIHLVSTSTLSTLWTFSGANTLQGDGTTLYFGPGGQFVLLPGASLALNDVVVRGLQNESFIFFDSTATMSLANATLELSSSMTTTVGTFYVEQPSRLIIHNFNFGLDNIASMTVDSVDLWVDTRLQGQYPTQGQFTAPLAMFPTAADRNTNWATNIAGGHLALLNTATVRDFYTEYLFGTANAQTDVVNGVANTPTGGTYQVAQSNFLSPDTIITVANDMTLDGRGGMLVFSRLDSPQLIIEAGVTLTLKNIQLSRIGGETISIGRESVINFENGVSWELSEDFTVSQGTLTMTNTGGGDVFTIRGLGGRKRFDLVPAAGKVTPLLEIGPNTLQFQEIEFTGIEQASISSLGNVALGGGATVNFYQDSSVSFEADDLANQFVFFKNNITLSGFIFYGNHAENSLSMKFSTLVIGNTIPQINLGAPKTFIDANGDTQLGATLDVASFAGAGFVPATGRCTLTFDNEQVIINSLGAGSFRVDQYSVIQGSQVQIEGFPILKASSNVIFQTQSTLFSTTLSNVIDTTPSAIKAVSLFEETRDPYNLSVLSQAEKNRLYYQALHGINTESFPNLTKPLPRPEPQAPKKPVVSAPEEQIPPMRARPSRSIEVDEAQESMTRAMPFLRTIPSEPTSFGTFVTGSVQASALSGNYRVDSGGILTKFATAASGAAIVKLNGGGTIQTATSGTVTIKSGDAIFALGTGNVIQVNTPMVINGNIVVEDSSALTFNIMRGGSVTFSGADGLVVGDQSTVTVTGAAGAGAFTFDDGATATFQSTDTADLPSKPAELIFSSGGTLKIKDASVTTPTVTFQGVGQVRFAFGGDFDTSVPFNLVLGAADTDNMVFRVETTLTLKDVLSGNATISLAKGRHGFVVSSPLTIGKNVGFEFNMLADEFQAKSFIHSFIINAAVSMTTSSLMRFATNLSTTSKEKAITRVDTSGGSLTGLGELRYSSFNTVSKTRSEKSFALNNNTDLFRAVASAPLESDLIASLVKVLSGADGYDFYKAYDGSSGVIGLDSRGRTSFIAVNSGDTVLGLTSDGSGVLAQTAAGANVSYRF